MTMMMTLTLVWQLENSEFKPVNFLFEIDLVLHHVRADGFHIYIYIYNFDPSKFRSLF